MSASGYKQTYSGQLANVRFTPESGHSDAQERMGPKKRSLDVRSYPISGHKWLWRWMSASDPKATLHHRAWLRCRSRIKPRLAQAISPNLPIGVVLVGYDAMPVSHPCCDTALWEVDHFILGGAQKGAQHEVGFLQPPH